MIVAMKHEKRRFVEKVDFVTSPGFHRTVAPAVASRVWSAGGMYKVVTDLAMLGFHPETRHMTDRGAASRVSLDEVRDNTGFDLIVADGVETTEAPTGQELAVLRELDPERLYTA